VSTVPIGWAPLVLDPVIDGAYRVELALKLPGEALDHRSAFLMAAKQAQGVSDPVPEHGISSAQ